MNIISAPTKVGKKDPISAGMTPEVVDDTLVLRVRPDGVKLQVTRSSIANLVQPAEAAVKK